MDGRANPLMARKVIGAVSFGVVALVTSPNTAGCGEISEVTATFCLRTALAIGIMWQGLASCKGVVRWLPPGDLRQLYMD